MKKIISLSVFVILAVVMSMYVFSSNANSQKVEVDSLVKSDTSIGDSKIVVYYFHTTFRCVSCSNLA